MYGKLQTNETSIAKRVVESAMVEVPQPKRKEPYHQAIRINFKLLFSVVLHLFDLFSSLGHMLLFIVNLEQCVHKVGILIMTVHRLHPCLNEVKRIIKRHATNFCNR